MIRVIVREVGQEGPEGHGCERYYTLRVDDGDKVRQFLRLKSATRTVMGIEIAEPGGPTR